MKASDHPAMRTVVVGLVAVLALLALGSAVVFVGLPLLRRLRVPSDVLSRVEPHREAAIQFAENARSRCPEVREMRLEDRLVGAVPASPALGTEIARWPHLQQVTVACMWPVDVGGFEGNSFADLYPERESRPEGSWGSYELDGRIFQSFDTREHVTVDWLESGAADQIRLAVSRPLDDGGYIKATWTFQR